MTLGPTRSVVLRWLSEPRLSPEDDGGGAGGGTKADDKTKTGDEGEKTKTGDEKVAVEVYEKDGKKYVLQESVDKLVGQARIDGRTAEQKRLADEAEAEKLKKAGDYQKLYETEKAAREAAETERDAAKLDGLRRDIGAEFGLSATLSVRLLGSTEAEIKKDAKKIADELGIDPETKKTTATNRRKPTTEGGSGSNKGGDDEASNKKQSETRTFAFQSETDVKRPGSW